ncbi:MAG: hypothetical protein ABIG08_00570 [bacterium]
MIIKQGKTNIKYLLIIIILAAIVGGGVLYYQFQQKEEVKLNKEVKFNIVSGVGIIRYISIEGGFYGLIADDGKKYDPTNLPQEFQKDNLKVEFKAKTKGDLESFHMWGTIVDIIEIEKIEGIEKIEDETAGCLDRYPEVIYEKCVPGEKVDGWSGIILYPNTLDTSNIQHDIFTPDIVKNAGIANYITSVSTCQTTWLIKINGEWKQASQIEFCNYIIDYNSSCGDCLLEWEEGCC